MTKQIEVSKANLEYVRAVANAHRITQRAALEEITDLACRMHRHASGLTKFLERPYVRERQEEAAAMTSEAVTA